MLILLLLALRATSADENDVYASDDNFVSPTQLSLIHISEPTRPY